jgi:hypothetical protein
MQHKKGIVCSIVIICFLAAQLPAPALAKYVAADQEATQVTRNAPRFKTTAPEPISASAPTSEKKSKKTPLLWGLVGLAAVAGLVAAVMSGGSGGGGGDGDDTRDTGETGSVTVEW